MNQVHVLDCTLRDGGYCNEWKFGFKNVKKIVSGLMEANIDIIECGFLTNTVTYCPEVTKFTTVSELAAVIPDNRQGKLFVAMMNFGEYDMDELPPYDGTSIDGIRVAFHKRDLEGALQLCEAIKEKGYQVFVQAMVSLSYTDEEFLELVKRANSIEPYAFYIVDSFGMMKDKDLIRLFYMVEHNLRENIWIGFHSHNNMQLAYANAQSLVKVQTNRNLVIDVSVYGMGRGAGNLNTELFVEYLNENTRTAYQLTPLLNIIDEILNGFYERNYWGYSLPNYLSAAHNAHPNYAEYLDDKKTLTVEDMNEVFDMMESDQRFEFNKNYIEELYLRYMAGGKVQESHVSELKEMLKGKEVLLIGPGKSSVEEEDKIAAYACQEDVVSISVNFAYQPIETDYVFLSNLRRLRELDESKREKCIVTSNIPGDKTYYLQIPYGDLVNEIEAVRDNAGLMAIKFLIDIGVEEIKLAGFDGYSHDVEKNYGKEQMAFVTRNVVLDALNEGMREMLRRYSEMVKISFVTTPKFVVIV